MSSTSNTKRRKQPKLFRMLGADQLSEIDSIERLHCGCEAVVTLKDAMERFLSRYHEALISHETNCRKGEEKHG